ncbi:hypothetical protein KC318_g4419 [Hortaea werneckii]|nr:hypothetical protein KC334_g4550 [Hortaea werneckii]KAI7015697.1 hypothetical protein KC355_g4259 [Hortaea werneckii]KAI7669803.1 hypothetical protein KC318_g4419 [Hortaea werneckii]
MTPPPPEPMVTPTSDQPWESSGFIEPRTPASTISNPLFLTPPPIPKKRKKRPEEGFGHTGHSANLPLLERTYTAQGAVPSAASPKPQPFSSFNREAETKKEADEHSGEQPLDQLYIMTDEELAQAVAAAEAFLDPTSRAQAVATEAQVLLPPLDQSYVHSETEAVDVASAAATKHVKTEQTPPRSVRTGNDDQSFHQGTGQQQPCNIEAKIVEGIKLSDLETQFTEEDLPNTLQAKRRFLQLVRRVANNVKDLYFLKASSQVSKAHLDDLSQQRQQKSRFQFDFSQSSFQEEKVSTLEPDYNHREQEPVDEKFLAPEEADSFNHRATSEPLQPSKAPEKLSQQTPQQKVPLSHSRISVKPTIEGTPAASERTLIPQVTPSPTKKPQSLPRNLPATAVADTISHNPRPELTPEMPDDLTGGLKRSAPTMTASRESTPSSKKPKFDELSARKLTLQKSLAEKKARKAEARRAFEELQKLPRRRHEKPKHAGPLKSSRNTASRKSSGGSKQRNGKLLCWREWLRMRKKSTRDL